MAKKRPLIIGNWKMLVESPDAAKKLAAGLKRKAKNFITADVWVAPAYPLVPVVAAALKGSHIKVGAQGVSQYEGGSHTGEVSAALLKSSGAAFAIVGHSERRAAGDTNLIVNAQLARALSAGMSAVLCIGETERTQDGAHFTLIETQLRTALTGVQSMSARLVVAYEPVWAIGKAAVDAMRPAEVEEMAIFIRKTLADILMRHAALRVPILYGGSVDAENADELMMHGGVQGLLVGRASAELESFSNLLQAVCRK